jgi:hypothetical protein
MNVAAGDRWEFVSLRSRTGFQVMIVTALRFSRLCSIELEKEATHGKRKTSERTVFEPQRGVASRQTLGGGGKSEMEIPECPRDALTFLHHVRRELASGRVPPPQTIYLDALHRPLSMAGGRACASERTGRGDRPRLHPRKLPTSPSSCSLR